MKSQREILLEKAKLVIKEAEKAGATQTQASVKLIDLKLTRLANSIIDQNVAERHAKVKAILYFGQQKGSVEYEVFQDTEIRNLVQMAAKIAKISPKNADFESLPTPKPYSSQLDASVLTSKNTLNVTPEMRAEAALEAIKSAHNVDDRISAVAGAIYHSTTEHVICNSLGIEAYEMRTSSEIEITTLATDGSEETAGWACDSSRDFNDLKISDVARVAAEKAANGFGMKDLEPGEYEVVLEPAAVAGLMLYISYTAFGAKQYQEYMSFLRDRLGEKMFSEKLSMYDNALDTRLVHASRFDEEGVPHQKVDLIVDGVVMGLVYDSLTATKDGVESTGNHAQVWGPPRPMARHLIVNSGNSSVDEMIEETEKGVLVTHFHYMNPVNPTEGVYTGLTRDGAWYIENGEIQYPLRTLRFTDAAPRFFNEIDIIGEYPEFRSQPPFGLMPSMKLPSFRFSGSSKH